MKEKLKKWIAVIGLMAFCLLAIGGPVGAAGAAARELSPHATSGARLGTQQENSTLKPNDPGNSAVVDGGFFAGAKAWAKDHGVGLLYGVGVGLVVGLAVAGIAVVVVASAPVWVIVGAGALAGGLYGLITGAIKFDLWDCVLFSVIGAVSAGVGTGLAAGWLARAAVDVVGGGLAMVGSYLLHEPHPTWGGAGQAFVIGAVTAGVFVGLGAAANKLFGPALGRLGGKLRNLLPWGRGAGAAAGEAGAAGGGAAGAEATAVGGAAGRGTGAGGEATTVGRATGRGSAAVTEGAGPGSGSALQAEAASTAEGAVLERAGTAEAGLTASNAATAVGGAPGRGSGAAAEGAGPGSGPGSGSAVETEAAATAEGALLDRAGAGEANAGLAKASQAGRIDYSGSLERDLTTFFPGYRLIDGPLDEEMVLVQYHRGDVPLGQGRSAKFWTTAEQGNGCFTMNEVCQRLALPPDWGPRDTVSVARIPRGTDVTYYIGQVKDQTSDITHELFSGRGIQLRFKNFDPAWIVETRSVR